MNRIESERDRERTLTSNRQQDAKPSKPGFFSTMNPFERTVIASVTGVVLFGAVAAVVSPPVGGTHAPRAAFDLESVLRLEPVPTMPVVTASLEGPAARNGLTVAEVRKSLAYDLDHIASGEALVPRVFLREMPGDLDAVPEVAVKKRVFFKSVLPLVLQANEEILRDRTRIQVIQAQKAAGKTVKSDDKLWVAMMSDRYGTPRGDLAALLRRVDVIPTSLAMAQAAKESGWGTSRFAVEGNALFGQWTWSEANGLEPRKRDEGKDHLVRHFDTLTDSVRAYMRNLNTHRAYREFRTLRAGLRAKGVPLDGIELAAGLEHYSELGTEYVNRIRAMILYNHLRAFDDAKLIGQPAT